MAGTRAYRRQSNGRFAGSGGGSMTTYGKAGGFANAAFRSRAASTNQKASKGRSFRLGQTARSKRVIRRTVVAGAGFAALGIAARSRRTRL